MSKLKKSRNTKAAKKVQRSERRTQSASATSATTPRSLPTAHRPLPTASVEEQIAMLEEKIAALSAESRDQSAERRVENENYSAPVLRPNNTGSLNSALPRAQLPTPALGLVLATSNAIVVTWEPVANSQQVLAVYSKDPDFENHGAVGVSGSMNSATITGLLPNTLYYIRIKATGTGSYTDSEYSSVKTVTTQRDVSSGTGDDTASQLQNWLVEQQTLFQNVAALVPQLENTELNTTDRRRLNGSGVRRYGFIEKTANVAEDFPQFWPAIVDDKENLNALVQEIEVLRNLLIWFRYASRITGDLLLIAGDQAFRLAGAYYAAARDGARRKNPEAQQVFEMLRLFWRRRRNTSAEPTERETMRDVRALLRGTKDGEVVVRNESDRVVKGEKIIIDNTQRKPRGGVKIIERGSAEFRDQSAE